MTVYKRNNINFILSEVFAEACALSTNFPNNPCTCNFTVLDQTFTELHRKYER